MRYVSTYNYFKSLDRLARAGVSKPGLKPGLSEALAGLSRFALRDVLTNDEIVLMYQHRTTLAQVKEWADSGVKIDAAAIRADLERRGRYFDPQFVMKVNTPRYHAKLECEFLRAKFENFETPPEIAQLGDDKVIEFQEFCDREWPQYRSRPIDIFWAHVGAHFRVPIAPKAVSYASMEAPKGVGDLSETEMAIDRKADSLREYADSNGLRWYLHARPKKLYDLSEDAKLDETRRKAFKELLKLKKAIKMLVFNAHRIELEMPEGLLSDELLHALGFLPCKACCAER